MPRKEAISSHLVLLVSLGILCLTHVADAQVLGDIDGNGTVDAEDLAEMLGDWGLGSSSPADLNDDDIVDGRDLGILLSNFGETVPEPNDIEVLVAGEGFDGATSDPALQGSSSSPGFGAKSIARWTELPYITRDTDFYVTVSAFHMTDINRVEFILDGGEPVVRYDVQPHPETGYAEYITRVDVSELTPGEHEIRAIAYPNHGVPRVLQGRTPSTNVHASNNGNESFWFNYDPNPTTVHVGPNGQYNTIDDAIDALGEDLYGGRIYLSEGTHHLLSSSHMDFRNTDQDLMLTIASAPGTDPRKVFIEGFSGMGDGTLRFGSLHVRDVTVISAVIEHGQAVFNGDGANRLMLEGIYNTAEDPINGWGILQVQRIADATTDWTKGCWLMNCTFVNVPKGVNSIMLAKNTTFTRMSADAFGSGPGAVINCWLDKADSPNSQHLQHADILQISITNDLTEPIENRIFADLRATNNTNQLGHISGPETNKYANFAFVRWEIDSMYSSSSLNLVHSIDHVILDGCTFRNSSASFGPDGLKHVLIRDCLMNKFRDGNLGFDGAFDAATTIIENLHFVQGQVPFPGTTVGEVYFAAPSAPVGTPSDGTGAYIPSYVMSDSEFTTQYIGNADVEKSGQIRDHFYYDKALLDLTWWR